MALFEEKFAKKLEQYAANFRIEDLNDANDKSLLNIMIKTEIMIDDLQQQIQELIEESSVTNAANIKKLADLLRDATGTITTVQKTLAIDRKTRKQEETGSVADYIRTIRTAAKEFVDKRLVKVYCPNCNIMVMRFTPVHDHVAFTVSCKCHQCNKFIRARRDDRDIFYDVRDAEWRREFKAEVVQPRVRKKSEPNSDAIEMSVDDEVILAAPIFEESELVELKPAEIHDELELGEFDGTTEESE